MPEQVLAEAPGFLHLLEAGTLARQLREASPRDHKGDFGHCLVVAGSNGKAGAALMAARGALVGGAGLVTVAVPRPLLTAVDTASLESMTLPLAADGAGALTVDSAAEVLEAAGGKSCVAIGPGLGTGGATRAAVRAILERLELPAVVDADALNAIAGRLPLLRARPAPTVLTPHPGEAARLFDVPVGEIESDRIGFARSRAMEHRVVLVLKGHQTVVASPDGTVHLNSTGNPGMASGGSGDVLTGLIAALISRHYDPVVAARLGVFIHGLAGDLALEERSVEGLVAGDLIEAIPLAFRRLRSG
jgi:NAD(P)H-hydrate epimerase